MASELEVGSCKAKTADGAYGFTQEDATGVKTSTYSNGATGFVGTQSSHPLSLMVGGPGKVSIDSLGTGAAAKTTLTGSATNGSGIVNTLHIKNTGTTVADGTKILFTSGASTDGAGIASGGVSTNSADLKFYTGGNNMRLNIEASGVCQFKNGISFDQTNTSASGAAATSSVLDHYEMGKWTGAFTAGSGTITIDSSNNEATYIRVGDLVHVEGRFSVSAISSPSGTLGITGLPFTGVADSVVIGETISGGACYFENAASAVTSPIIFGPNGTNSSLEVRESGTTGAGTAPASKVDTGTVILFSISYRCA